MKKTYVPPTVETLGTLRQLTHNANPGVVEGGAIGS